MDFQKTSQRNIPGRKKAAILFGELDPAAAEGVMDYLNADEKKMLLKAMRKLGTKYNPNNPAEVRDEIQVLETLERFGKVRNIYKDVASERKAFEKVAASPATKIKNALNDYPDKVASVLSAWLRKDE
ncbi:MAG: hypothetical protein K2N58_05455 [Treponemataceae bacterium]|nr:hypothetical protein [Treponemataceae bacterium]